MDAEDAFDGVSELLVTFAEFGTPTTKPVDFAAIIGGDLSHEARELLHVASQERDTLLDGITNEGARVDPRNVVAAVETYIPSVYKITYGMERSASAQIKLNKPLEFSWTSVLLKKSRQKKDFKCHVLVYEVCFVLVVQAMAHYNVARLLLGADQINRASNLVAAAKELRKGAGILEFVAQGMLPRWVNPPENRPPEVVAAVVAVLAEYFVCMAQRVTIQQAIMKGTPPSTIAKLLLGLSERSHNLVKSVQALGPRKDTLLEPIVEEPALISSVAHALAMKYLGDASVAKEKPGEAVAYLSMSADLLGSLVYSPTMEKQLRAKVEAARSEILDVYDNYRENNEKIYFEGVPTRDRLQIPHGSFIATAVDYSLPEVDVVLFGSPAGANEPSLAAEEPPAPAEPPVEKRSSLSSWFGLGGSKKKLADSKDEASSGLQAPPGYDKEVFDGLPVDIQQEVIAAYNAEHRK